jgi:hypothetical protein
MKIGSNDGGINAMNILSTGRATGTVSRRCPCGRSGAVTEDQGLVIVREGIPDGLRPIGKALPARERHTGPRRMVHSISMERIDARVNVVSTIDGFNDVGILVRSKIMCIDGTTWG